jgi:hypothetical protein
VRIWQEAVKKSLQLAAGLELELEQEESETNMARRTGPLKANRGRRGRCSASKLYLVDLWGNNDLVFSPKVNV